MYKTTIKLAVIGALGFVSSASFAAGTFCSLASAPTGSAYINLYNDGRTVPPLAGPAVTPLQSRLNFGGDYPYGGPAGSCQITGLANEATAPISGYGLQVTSNSQNVFATDGVTVIGNATQRIWRNTSVSPASCILGTKVTLSTNAFYNGSLYFELNDIAVGGYSGSGGVNVGYFAASATPALSPIYRAGRSFTSVQHRSYRYVGTQAERQNNGIGYLDLPTIGGSPTLNINGVNAGIAGTTIATATAAQQEAQINSNWVDFTVDAGYQDDDGGTNPVSAIAYVEFACNSDSAAIINTVAPSGSTAGWRKAGALRLRQTAQENTTFHEISLTGYAPPGATVP